MGYVLDWASCGLGLLFIGLGWAELRILEPMTNTAGKPLTCKQQVVRVISTALSRQIQGLHRPCICLKSITASDR